MKWKEICYFLLSILNVRKKGKYKEKKNMWTVQWPNSSGHLLRNFFHLQVQLWVNELIEGRSLESEWKWLNVSN